MTDTLGTDSEMEKRAFDDKELASLLHAASKMMARAYHRHAHAHHAQEDVFSIIRDRGQISQKELMNILDVRSSSLSEMLAKLEQRGLIERERNEEDKRGFIVSVKEGVEIPTSPHKKHEVEREGPDPLFAVLDQEEKNQLGVLMEKLVAAMDEGKGHGKREFFEKKGRGRGRGECPHKGHGKGHRGPRDD